MATGSWFTLEKPPITAIDVMLLMTDGSVMCHAVQSPDWYFLKPARLLSKPGR
jgi:hypothetical protein